MSGRAYLAVGSGSALGATLRYLVAQGLVTPAFPWATLAVNGLGSWLIAAFAAYTARRRTGRLTRWQPFFMAGLCGGFTTFSLFGLETLRLLESATPWRGGAYLLASGGLWLGAAWHGDRMGRRLAGA